MIDIHSHILPGIDDGASDSREAVKICDLAANLGCEAIIATPHQRHPAWWNTELVKLEILLDHLQKTVGDRIRLYLGAEIRVGEGFMRDLENFSNSGLASLAGSDYLLLEFERRKISVDPIDIVERVQAAGWRPIVAHPEFIDAIAQDVPQAQALVEAGALMQITAMSLDGDFGFEARDSSTALLEAGLVHFVASDCHGYRRRPPGLKSARIKIKTKWGREYADRLTIENPRAVLENRPVEPFSLGAVTTRG